MEKYQLKSAESEADRYVPTMPNIHENGRPNLRKLGQLPFLLVSLGLFDEFFNEVRRLFLSDVRDVNHRVRLCSDQLSILRLSWTALTPLRLT